MKSKQVITAIILATALGGCQNNTDCGCGSASIPEKSAIVKDSAETGRTSRQVVAYYFHRAIRCTSCLMVELNTQQLGRQNFADELANGNLLWITVNLDEPENKQLQDQFDVSVNTLLLARNNEQGKAEYKKLDEVWNLQESPDEMKKYISREIGEYLK